MVDQQTRDDHPRRPDQDPQLVRAAVRLHAGEADAIDEGNGKSLLDNMLFFWTNELGEGGKHTYVNVPMVLAGSCGGQLPTGRYIDYLGNGCPGVRARHGAQQALRRRS